MKTGYSKAPPCLKGGAASRLQRSLVAAGGYIHVAGVRGDNMQERKHNAALTPRAKTLRKEMTKEERRLWYDFLCSYPVRFLRQKVIDCYIADFYCHQARLIVELDGSQHYEEENTAYDRNRTVALESRGLKVIRFPNNAITANFDDVCQAIDKDVRVRISPQSKSPPCLKGGAASRLQRMTLPEAGRHGKSPH